LEIPISYWHTTNKSTCTRRSCLGSVNSGAKPTSSHGTSWKTPSWDTMKNTRCLEDSKLMGKNYAVALNLGITSYNIHVLSMAPSAFGTRIQPTYASTSTRHKFRTKSLVIFKNWRCPIWPCCTSESLILMFSSISYP
jgi:hypothetical protein